MNYLSTKSNEAEDSKNDEEGSSAKKRDLNVLKKKGASGIKPYHEKFARSLVIEQLVANFPAPGTFLTVFENRLKMGTQE